MRTTPSGSTIFLSTSEKTGLNPPGYPAHPLRMIAKCHLVSNHRPHPRVSPDGLLSTDPQSKMATAGSSASQPTGEPAQSAMPDQEIQPRNRHSVAGRLSANRFLDDDCRLDHLPNKIDLLSLTRFNAIFACVVLGFMALFVSGLLLGNLYNAVQRVAFTAGGVALPLLIMRRWKDQAMPLALLWVVAASILAFLPWPGGAAALLAVPPVLWLIGKKETGVGGWRKPLDEAWAESVRSRLAVNAKDGSILVRIPAGEFVMGDGTDADNPKHHIELSEYWMGVYCVKNLQYRKFVAATKHRVPDNQRLQQRELADHPVTGVSWDDCAAYAKWGGLSLPTEAQWENAVRGPSCLIYPWGNEWDQNKYRNTTNRGTAQTAAVWEYANGTSGYGTIQQAGNVWEWCADWYEDSYYQKSPAKDPIGPQTGRHRVLRGGSWSGDGASAFRGAPRPWHSPADRCADRGFRLVRNNP